MHFVSDRQKIPLRNKLGARKNAPLPLRQGAPIDLFFCAHEWMSIANAQYLHALPHGVSVFIFAPLLCETSIVALRMARVWRIISQVHDSFDAPIDKQVFV